MKALKLTLIVPEMKVADVAFNLAAIRAALPAKDESVGQLVILPELALTGKTCGDLFFQPNLVDGAKEGLRILIEECHKRELWMVAGLPVRKDAALYNAAAVIGPEGLKLFSVEAQPKLPQFSGWERDSAVDELEFDGSLIMSGAELKFDLPDLTRLGVQVIVGSPCHLRQSDDHLLIINLHTQAAIAGQNPIPNWVFWLGNGAENLVVAGISAGPGESTTDWVASGKATITINHTVKAETRGLQFESELCQYEIAEDDEAAWECRDFPKPLLSPTPFIQSSDAEKQFAEVLDIQAAGLLKRLRHTKLDKVVLGNSGGADSAMALLVCLRAFKLSERPVENILAVSMPGPGSTADSYERSVALAKAAGVSVKTISISEAVAVHLKDISHPEGLHDVTFENAQARERTQILMDLANQQRALVVGTGDLSEIALGWSTFNGDHMSMYNVNAGLPKTLLLRVLAWAGGELLGETGAAITEHIAKSTISPELVPGSGNKPAQSTEAILGPYLLHDFFLWHAIGQHLPPRGVFELAQVTFKDRFSSAEVLRVLRIFYQRFFGNQFKRSSSADGPQVTPISLSPRGGWAMPSDASAALWLKELEGLSD